MNFDESFFKEEVRWDFRVDKKRKRVWAVALNLFEQLDIVCKKYNIPYYVYYGTLLGAVRHKGFIPWDDDIDVLLDLIKMTEARDLKNMRHSVFPMPGSLSG